MLIKNVIRTLLKKWMQVLAIGVIIVLSSFAYALLVYSMSGFEEPTREYLKDYKQEDFSVEFLNMATEQEIAALNEGTPLPADVYTLSDIRKFNPDAFYGLIEKRRILFEEKYSDYSLELREYKSVIFENDGRQNKALVLKNAERINLTYLEAGRLPIDDDEIALTKMYAGHHDLELGNRIDINGSLYSVTGFILLPDYTFPMLDNSFNVDVGLQTLIISTDEGYENFSGKEGYRFSGMAVSALDKSAFETEVIGNVGKPGGLPFVIGITLTENQLRSGAIYDELTQGRVMSLGFSILLASLAILVVSIIVYKILHAERGQIGVLKALGYSRWKIGKPYVLLIVMIALPMLLLGYLAGTLAAEPLKKVYLDYYLLPSREISQSLSVFLISVFVPLIFFVLFSGIIIMRMLSTRALELLRPPKIQGINSLSRFVSRMLKNARGKVKFKYLYAIKNTGKFLLFFIGIMFSTILLFFSFMLDGIIGRMTTDYFNKVDYQYESFYDITKGIPPVSENEEKFLFYPYSTLDGTPVTAVGLTKDGTLYQLTNKNDEDLTDKIKDGVVITANLSLKLGYEIEETIGLKIGDGYTEHVIKGITDEYTDAKVYMDIEKLSSIITEGENRTLFSGIYSLEKPSAANYDVVINKDSLIEQAVSMQDFIKYVVYVMIVAAALISTIILFILTSLTVEDNYYTISLLKVLGYSKKEVNAMIMNSYLSYTILSFTLSIPISVSIISFFMEFIATRYGIILPLEFKPLFILLGFLLISVIFYLGTYSAKRKIRKISLQEALKAYSE